MNCEFQHCGRRAKYFMGWLENGDKKFGMVCATHDKILGRKNLMATGMTIEEAIKFERYAKETEE